MVKKEKSTEERKRTVRIWEYDEQYRDPLEDDQALDEYIEDRRREFHNEWFRYIAENSELDLE